MERDGSKGKVGDAPGGGFSEGFVKIGQEGGARGGPERAEGEKRCQVAGWG